MDEQKYWLGFSLIPEIGMRRTQRLLHRFGDLSTAWTANERDLHASGLERSALNNLLTRRAKLDLEGEWVRVERLGASIIAYTDEHYPPLLRQLLDAPLILYVRGALLPADERALSIVGTRKATRYGLDAAHRLAGQLVAHHVTIISGLAHGIDAAAHRGALEGGGRTLAVMGSGIDEIYPREHRELAQTIAQNGALISEFPPGTKPEKNNFPRRNRIISGMSLGVLVVEAPEGSGALITASTALEQGRDVFAVPGSIFSLASGGTNRLIQDGAALVMTAQDILDALNIAHELTHTRTIAEAVAPVSEVERAVLQLVSAEPTHIDEFVRQSGLATSVVSSTLTLLELKGLIDAVGGMHYTLAH